MIRHLGTIKTLTKGETFTHVEVTAPHLAEICEIKDSINVNGICLTVSSKNKENIGFDLVDETLQRTNAKYWTEQTLLHLEPAMSLGDKIDGHLVSGHIDDVGIVERVEDKENAKVIEISVSKEQAVSLVEKGSVAINGVSLTVASLTDKQDKSFFEVWLIPTTLENTTLGTLTIGDRVNLEFDMIGKYVSRFLQKVSS